MTKTVIINLVNKTRFNLISLYGVVGDKVGTF